MQNGSFNINEDEHGGEVILRRRRNVTPSTSLDEQFGLRENDGSLASEPEQVSSTIKRKNSSIKEFEELVPEERYSEKEDEFQPNGECISNLKGRSSKPGIFEFLWMEISRRYTLQNEQEQYSEKRRKVYAFLRIPVELERFIFYGFRHCLDAFCHMFTLLPIRVIINLIGCIFRFKSWSGADTCDVLKLVIIFCASWFMQFVDTSMMYHLVRGQGVIKLYIFYNMLEVADKLFSSFGQDILDALLWTASERGGKRKFLSTVFHLIVAIVYALCHTLLILLQATTLNVAFNSHNQSLLTIMMSNNFVELKGSVFKKFGKPNLFQMSCSDVRERFHTVILLLVVVLRNMTAVNWKLEHLYEMAPDLLMIIVAEHIVDWLKHAFITKFNEISTLVYRDFTITIAYDVIKTHEVESFSDFSDQVSRRMGFVPLPTTIMLIRVISQSVDVSNEYSLAVLISVWFFVLMVKLVNGVMLYNKATDQVEDYESRQGLKQCDSGGRSVFFSNVFQI